MPTSGRSRREHPRLYWRKRGKVPRAYGDFRDFSDVGGGREALIPSGKATATSDPEIAEQLITERLSELHKLRRNKALLGVDRQATLSEFASYHLVQKAKAGRVTEDWLADSERRLQVAIDFFGEERDLASIRVSDIQKFVNELRERPNGRGGTLSGGTIRHYLNVLSNLYRRAASEGYVPPGHNPVSALVEKPQARRREARWLEVHEAALLLESARTYVPDDPVTPSAPIYPILATFLLTGGRKKEVLGLALDDVNFERSLITFRPNEYRRLKTSTSHRSVPIWPQLQEILKPYVLEQQDPTDGLLFPSPWFSDEERVIQNLRKVLDTVAHKAGWDAGDITPKMFRHTYCAARLQTLDRGAPVSPWTVAQEMGHGGRQLVDRVYGHLGQVRHRSEVVEFRVDQHREELGERLEALLGES